MRGVVSVVERDEKLVLGFDLEARHRKRVLDRVELLARFLARRHLVEDAMVHETGEDLFERLEGPHRLLALGLRVVDLQERQNFGDRKKITPTGSRK